MKKLFVCLSIILFGCRPASTTNEIIDLQEQIEENIKKARETDFPVRDTINIDGPYPADTYTLRPNGEFYIASLFVKKQDSVWIIFQAKSEQDIITKYPKLTAYKTRPEWLEYEDWSNMRNTCLNSGLIFDLKDAPKGWLLENEQKLK